MRRRYLLFAVVLLLSGFSVRGFAPDLRSQALFPGPRTDLNGSHIFGFALGDFDRDGRVDAILGGTNLPFLKGRGNGFFDPPTGNNTNGIEFPCAGDFDGDGILDLAGFFGLGVVTMNGLGDGTFGTPRQLPGIPIALYEYSSISRAADFDGDGKLDLVNLLVAFYPFPLTGQLYFSHGFGDGTFDVATPIEPDAHLKYFVIADLNQDGHPDILTEDDSETLRILDGRGDGTFDAPVALTGPGSAGMPMVGDVNGDGRPDLVVADGTSLIQVRLGRSDGTLSDPMAQDFGQGALEGVLVDLDGDGCDDLTITTLLPYGNKEIRSWRSRCDGTWSGPGPFVGGAPDQFSNWGVADLNGDHRGDFVVGIGPEQFYEPNQSILIASLGHADGTFAKAAEFVPGADARAPVVRDLDRDGRPDVVLAGYDTDEILVLHGLSGGGFGEPRRIPVGHQPTLVGVGDFDGDGRLDLVASHSQGVSVAFALPAGGYSTETRLPGVDPATQIVVLDINHDGIDDVALGGPAGVQIELGVSGGLPLPTQVVPLAPVYLLSGDFNGDGYRDLALMTCYGAKTLIYGGAAAPFHVWPSLDTTTSSGATCDSGPFAPPELTVGDFNEDGRDDLVFSVHRSYQCYLGRPDQGLDPLPFVEMSTEIGIFQAADFDRDGHLDLELNQAIGTSILYGDGSATFLPGSNYYSAFGETADVDGDGNVDLVRDNLVMYSEANRPPVARATADSVVECTSPAGASVHLDGSASTDPDSTADQSDIAHYDWFENYGTAGQVALGSGVTLDVTLALGVHSVTLRVTDHAGESATAQVTVQVADTTPPSLQVAVSPDILWPPNHQMIPIHAQVLTSDVCSSVTFALVSVTSSDPDDAPGSGDGNTTNDVQGVDAGTPDVDFSVRAERSGVQSERTYTALYRAVDAAGNATTFATSVLVPKSRKPLPVIGMRYHPEGTKPPAAVRK